MEYADFENRDYNCARLWYYRGKESLSDIDKISCFEEALKCNGNDIKSLMALENIYYSLEKYEDAKSICFKLLKIKRNNSLAHNNLGRIYLKEKKYDDAIKSFKIAIKTDKENPFPHNGIGDYYKEKKEYNNAIIQYERAIDKANRKGKEFSSPWNGWGDILRLQEKYNEAIKKFDKAIELNENFIWPWYFKALCYLETNQYENAQICYEKILEINPDFQHLEELEYKLENLKNNKD